MTALMIVILLKACSSAVALGLFITIWMLAGVGIAEQFADHESRQNANLAVLAALIIFAVIIGVGIWVEWPR